MGIRISHGDVKTLAQFAVEAGKGEQKVRAAGEAAATQRTQMQIDAQLQSQAMNAQADIDMAIMDAQNRRSAMEFQSFLGAETARRNMAWEQDKVEQMRQHDLDMLMTRKELESSYQMEQEMREQSKTDAKLKALDDAVEAGTISRDEAEKEKLRVEIGVSGRQSELYSTGKVDPMAAFMQAIAGGDTGERASTANVPQPVRTTGGLSGEILENAAGERVQYNSETRQWQKI